MQPLAAVGTVVVVLAAFVTSGPNALVAAAGPAHIDIGVALQLDSGGSAWTGISQERLNGLTLLQRYTNTEASDPFRLMDGSRITVHFEVRNYTDSRDLAGLYGSLASDVHTFIGPYAKSTSDREVTHVLETSHRLQKVIIIDGVFVAGSTWRGTDAYPYAFFTGIDGATVMTDGLRALHRAWANTSDPTLGIQAAPSMVVITGCEPSEDCQMQTYVCDSAMRAGRDLGFAVLGQYTFEDTTLPPRFQQIKITNPDVMVVCATTEDKVVNSVVTARALGLSPKAILMGGATQQSVIDAVGASNANYILSPVSWDHRKGGLACRIFGSASGFRDAYMQHFGIEPGAQAASAAAAGLALLASVENVGRRSSDPQEISQGLSNLNLHTFYRKLAFGPNRTLLDAESFTQQVQPLPRTFQQSERFLGSSVKLLDGDLPLFPAPTWQDKALEVFPCEAGSVIDPREVNLTCMQCPAGTQRPYTELECRTCPVGYYNSEPGQATCDACPRGADCRQGESTVRPPAKPAFYLLPNSKRGRPFYQECDEGICAGGNQCFGGNTGILCNSCSPGYTDAGMSIQGKSSVCAECPGVAEGAFTMLAVVLYLGILLGVLMRTTLASMMSVRAITSVMLKIFVNYMHMTCAVCSLTFMERLPIISFLVDINLNPLSSLASSDCIFIGQNMKRYQVHTILGLSMVPLTLAIIYMVHQVSFYLELRRISQEAYRFVGSSTELSSASDFGSNPPVMGEEGSGAPTPRRTIHSRREQAVQDMIIARRRWAIVVIFVLYPAMVKRLMVVVTCHELDVLRLSVEQDVECLAGDHIWWLLAGVFGLVFYGLGIPLAMFITLYRIKDRLMGDNERRLYGFLYNGFQPQYYYFEAVYMVRKFIFLLLGCVPAPLVRIIVMFVFMCGFLGIQIRCQPYDNRDFFILDHLECAGLLAILVTLTTSWMYTNNGLVQSSTLGAYWEGGTGKIFYGFGMGVVIVFHAYVWSLLLWALMRNSIMRVMHFKGQCVPGSVSRFGRILLKLEPNMNSVAYNPQTHRMDVRKLTRRERTFLLYALCDTLEGYVENGSNFHPGRLATCLGFAIDLCITDRKARARELCKVIAERRNKQGVLGAVQFYSMEAWQGFQRCFKAGDRADGDAARRKMPKGAKTLMREALQKVGGPTAVIEELQSALMLCERHIAMGKGCGPYYEIDKPSCDFTQMRYTDEEDERRRSTMGLVGEAEDDSKWKIDTKTLFGSASRSMAYNEEDEEEGEDTPKDVRLPTGKEDSFARTAAEVGLDVKALRSRQAVLAAEARELKLQYERLQRQLRAVKEPEKATAPIEPPAQLPQGKGVRELHLARSISEDDLKDDLTELVAPAPSKSVKPDARNQDMEEFLASLMDEKVGKYWRYKPVNGAAMMVRTAPYMEALDSGHILKPGTTFRVAEEREGDDGVVFLKLADGRGWVFDQKPGVGIMCVRV